MLTILGEEEIMCKNYMIHGTIFPELKLRTKDFDISFLYMKEYLNTSDFCSQTLTKFDLSKGWGPLLNDICYLKYCEKKGLTFEVLENGLVICKDILTSLD